MDDIDPADRITLRQIGRRNLSRFLPMMMFMLVVWWFAYHWMERHFGIEENLARYGTLFAAGLLVWSVMRATGLSHADPRLTPRLRQIAEAGSQRSRNRARLWQIGGLTIMLLSQLSLIGLGGREDRSSAWAWLFAASALGAWNSDLYGNEAGFHAFQGNRRHQALYYGYLTVMGLGAVLVISESYWPGSAFRFLPAVIIAGVLVPKIILSLGQTGKKPLNEIDADPVA